MLATNLGFPRVGAKRELKKALESFWAGDLSENDMLKAARDVRDQNWKMQEEAGLDVIPVNDFTLYDHVLDMAVLVGAVPDDYKKIGDVTSLDVYFAMARGKKDGVPALEMTKWFDTNYHYIVPVLSGDQQFALCGDKPVREFIDAREQGYKARPVILGPVSFLLLSKRDDQGDPLALLDQLLPVYESLLQKLSSAGADWVQMDEPCLVLDLSHDAQAAYKKAYERLAKSNIKILLATYFGGLRDHTKLTFSLPVDGVHVDLVRAPEQLEDVLKSVKKDQILSMGVVDGRNIWRTDLDQALAMVSHAVEKHKKDHVWVAASCSLLHSPIDLSHEQKMDPEIKNWLAFGKQKIEEIKAIVDAVYAGKAEGVAFDHSRAVVQSRKTSPRIHNVAVQERVAYLDRSTLKRSDFATRRAAQKETLDLPGFPTTTIGSFPQTKEVRQARAAHRRGELSDQDYEVFLKQQVQEAIKFQEEIGIDMLVHGEFERNDMVEYFGEQLNGYVFSQNGWVQSYGSRCVKPPIIYGDVSRKNPMTVAWSAYAQSLTTKPVKGMLTGPVTMLQWSFVRDDQPRSTTCTQIALAIHDEAVDLERAGIKAIQIDEPAVREGLPLARAQWDDYLRWAIDCFRLSASGVQDDTQIHTHMCYCEFNDIIDEIGALDADVISIETSRSQMELLNAFVAYQYPNEIGPGVYDIHSPRVPDVGEMVDLLHKAKNVLSPDQIWVNPDCGLKTRGWQETKAALIAMVQAARELRRACGMAEKESLLKVSKAS